MGHYSIDSAAVARVPSSADVSESMDKLAETIFEESQSFVPVETGHLKESGFTDSDGSAHRIGYTADYSAYVELGTRYMNAEPYLRPAALKYRGRI